MTFCQFCGREITEGAVYCPSCGRQVRPGRQTEFDRLTRDLRTQVNWGRRVVAYVIDWVIVSIATAIIEVILFLAMGIAGLAALGLNFSALFVPFGGLGFGVLGISAVLFLLYFTISETIYQKTFGKSIMGLKVVTTDGSRFDIVKAFLRNLSKIYWLLLLLDLIGGFFTHVEPGQKFSDHIANTVVVTGN